MELWKWSASETADKIKSGDVSCLEVVDSHLKRLADINPLINAVPVQFQEESRAQAQEMDKKRRQYDVLPPLYGVPVTTKINVDLIGQANSDGVVAYKNNLASADAPVVANLKADGAIIIGQTNTPEFSIRWFTSNALHGTSLNPWDPEYTPGGSSGAAAGAVAAGIGCIAHGNDMGGSLRYPAFCCGVSTIRPSFGRIANASPSSNSGRPPVSQLFSVQGPIGRTVADVRLALASMSKYSPWDADWTPTKDSGRTRQASLKIAYNADPFAEGITPGIRASLDKARAALEAAGHTVIEVELPQAKKASELWGRLTMAEVDSMQIEALKQHGSEGVNRSVSAMRAFFGASTLQSLMLDLTERNRLRCEWSLFLDTYDLVLMPVSSQEAFVNDFDFLYPEKIDSLLRAQRFLLMINMLGLPSVAVPTGLSGQLPVGVQLVGAPLDDELCLSAAEQVEAYCGTLSDRLWQHSFIAR